MSMNRALCIAAAVLAICHNASAGNWESCDLKVQVRDRQSNRAELQTRVIEAKPQAQAECPQPGSALSFRPETEDYQSELPRRQWPSPGKTVNVRYRYLDGECKERGPCRIQHYSPVLR